MTGADVRETVRSGQLPRHLCWGAKMGSDMAARAELRFFGKVQGVSFREYTKRYARDEQVRGWVENLSDGSVRAVLEGEKSDIERVIHRLCKEHPVAEVERFEVIWTEPTGEFSSFTIRR